MNPGAQPPQLGFRPGPPPQQNMRAPLPPYRAPPPGDHLVHDGDDGAVDGDDSLMINDHDSCHGHSFPFYWGSPPDIIIHDNDGQHILTSLLFYHPQCRVSPNLIATTPRDAAWASGASWSQTWGAKSTLFKVTHSP